MNTYGIIFKLDQEYTTRVVEASSMLKASKLALEYIKFKRPKIFSYHLTRLK